MKYFKAKKGYRHRCKRFGCRMYVQPHDFHPIFMSGKHVTPLADQAAILFMQIAGVKQNSMRVLWKKNHKVVESLSTRSEQARMRYVIRKEKQIVFGKGEDWKDVEADEADLGSIVVTEENDPPELEKNFKNTKKEKKNKGYKKKRPVMRKQWEQWGGMVERGAPHTLILSRLKPRRTSHRSPGPGPISRRDWKPLAMKHLAEKKVVLHTDGARTYKLAVPGVLHDNIVHKRKQMKIKGRMVWVRPKYTKLVSHSLPNGKVLKVKAGTQIIDRFWKHLRKYLEFTCRRPGNAVMTRKIRCAQWSYWHKNDDRWLKLGLVCDELFRNPA